MSAAHVLAVTGASGFLGRAFSTAALRKGFQVRGLTRGAVMPEGVEIVEGSVADGEALRNLCAGADTVVHLAAQGVLSGERGWDDLVRVNIAGSLAVMRAAHEGGVPHCVAVGTCLEYAGRGSLSQEPGALGTGSRCAEDDALGSSDAYGASKAAGGLLLAAYAAQHGLSLCYLRLASLYGPGDHAVKLVPGAVAAAVSERSFATSGGEQVRDWLHIGDAVSALLLAVERRCTGGPCVINVGTGRGVSTRDLLALIWRAAGASEALIEFGALPYRNGEARSLVLDVRRAHEVLGFKASVLLEDGIRQLVLAERALRRARW